MNSANHCSKARNTRGLAFVAAAMVFAFGVFALPQSASAKYASFVMDANTGRVLHAVNADTRNYPASLTKMMTLYMIFGALERGEISYQTKWIVSARASRQPVSHLALGRVLTPSWRGVFSTLVT